MAENKTKETKLSVTAFLNSIENPVRRRDAKAVAKLMRSISGYKAKMWGSSIVGYGSYHYKYASGREGDFMRVGFSPRKQNLVLYIISGFKSNARLLNKLGKHKIGKSCLYVKTLDDIDLDVLTQLIEDSLAYMATTYPE